MSHPDFPSLSSDNSGKGLPDDVYVPPYVPVAKENLDLNKELLDQYNAARKLLHTTEYDLAVPANQKAQVINSLSAIISTLIKQQQELYNLEQLKKMETALLFTLKKYPEMQKQFLEDYEKALNDK